MFSVSNSDLWVWYVMKQTDRHLVIGLLFLALLAGFGVGLWP